MKQLSYLLALSIICIWVPGRTLAAPLQVVATTPDIGDLARAIGGNEVEVVVLAKPGDDPHFLEAKPSFVRLLNRADAVIQIGLELEAGWLPSLLRAARNPRLAPGRPGFIDASEVITPLDVPQGPVDRSQGDIHPHGNPHYMLDPRAGRAVAELIAQRFSALKPESAPIFADNLARTLEKISRADAEAEAMLAPFRGEAVVGDHRLWTYFADRYGIIVAGYLEPKPGLPPTSRHLQHLAEQMKARRVRAIIASPYFDEKHVRFVSERTGAAVARLAHQPGSRPGADNYPAMILFNARTLSEALGPSR